MYRISFRQLSMADIVWKPLRYAAVIAAYFALIAICLPPPLSLWQVWVSRVFNALGVIGAAAMLTRIPLIRRCTRWIGRQACRVAALSPHYTVTSCALLFFILTCVLSTVLFSHIPHIADSQAHYVQGKIFASGHFSLPRHLLSNFFPIQFFSVAPDKWYSSYPPGHSLLLALGFLAGTPWVINPLLGSLFVINIYFLGREIGNRTTGLIAMLLAILTPYVVFMSSEYMNHSTALLSATLFILFYIRMVKYSGWRDALFAGMALGYLCITRPNVAAVLGLVFIPHAGWYCLRHFRTYTPLNLALSAAVMPFLAFFMLHNKFTTGDMLLIGYEQVQGGWVWDFGTWLKDWSKWRLFPLEDFARAAGQAGTLNLEFFCWPIFSFIPMLLLFIFKAQKPYARLLAATFIITVFTLTLIRPYWNNLFSARYLYEISGAVIVLTALALQRTPAIARHYFLPRLKLYTCTGAVVLSVMGLTIAGFFGRTGELYKTYATNYWEGNVSYYRNIVRNVQTPALVLIGDYPQMRFVVFNMPPDDKAPIIFAQDIPAENNLIIAYYPHRHVYRVSGANIQRVRNKDASSPIPPLIPMPTTP